MNKEEVADALDEIGTLLELKGENAFRTNAYHNGARAILQMQGDINDVIAQGKLTEAPGIGETLREKITTLVTTGSLPYLEKLRAEIPAGLVAMLRIPGVGPKKVKVLHDTLHIKTLDDLKAACEQDRIAKLKGFGAKTQAKILEGIAFLNEVGHRVRIDQALPIGQKLLEFIRQQPGVIRAELGGSLRRRRETAKDIDLLASSDKPGPIMEAFVSMPSVKQVIGHGDTKSSVVVEDWVDGGRVILNADLRIVTDKQFPFALHYFTGNKDHNIKVRQRAIDRGLKLNEYELVGDGKNVSCTDETELFAALELDFIPPEMRENTGEIDLAAWENGKSKYRIPRLVEVSDIRGVFHNHTTASDGHATLEEMAQAAKKLGFEYLGIADHSQSLNIANGLSPARVQQQHEQIDALNAKLKGIKLLKGTEVDILEDGGLDFPDKVLETFDYVVVSVHTLFNQPEDVMTNRIIQAVRHPLVTMLGHATGRLLLRREGYKVNLDRVIEACAEAGTMIEINAQPTRLDLDWVYCKRAKSLGIPLVINPDAHSTGELALFEYGVNVARRAWLEKGDVFNTKSLKEVSKALEI
ncbi:MAG: DNA polymerase/3'-5' exonuclease PolX [Gemmataceae bacterium]